MNSRQIAIIYHDSQKYGMNPYVYHLDEVADIVRNWCYDNIHLLYVDSQNILIDSAYLHDVLEDTYCPLEFIFDKFGEEVAKIVWLVTDPIGDSRKQKKKNYIKR